MNYPNKLLIFNTKQHNYQNLPLKITKLNLIHHHKISNILHNLFHVHIFTQNNTHIFYTNKQIKNQIIEILNLIQKIYNTFNFNNIHIKLSTHPKKFINKLTN